MARTSRRASLLLAAAAAAAGVSPATAFYLPGSAPTDYVRGQPVPLLVNHVSPQVAPGQSQLHSLISYDYYDERFGFCRPQGHDPRKQGESLGSVLSGDRLYDSPFALRMLENETCVHVCTSDTVDAPFFVDAVQDASMYDWLVDGLPAGEQLVASSPAGRQQTRYTLGFPLGERTQKDDAVSVNNHFDIVVDYHSPDHGQHFRVVGALVYPSSVAAPSSATTPTCDSGGEPLILRRSDKRRAIAYTYSVHWRESPTPWATRWDAYLRVFDARIHVLALVNASVVAAVLCLLLALVLVRTLHGDIVKYNALAGASMDDYEGSSGAVAYDDPSDESGWKLVHGDVFRPPRKRMLLAVLVGSGAQMAAMALATILFALLGFLSPSNRGALTTVMVVCWTLFGLLAGYVTARVYASLRGEQWTRAVVLTSTLVPGSLFAFVLVLDVFLIGVGSSGAVPFGTLCAVAALWLFINAPLAVLGAIHGRRKGPLRHPVRVNSIPRQVPRVPTWLRPVPSAILAGALPFGAAALEVYFVLQSLFGAHRAYYAFGFLALALAVVALTTATATVLMTYFHLCAEDFRWHWRAFLAGGGSAFWLALYGLAYWATRLELEGFTNKVLYVGYLALICFLDFMVFGFVGFVSAYAFVRVIYARIRVD